MSAFIAIPALQELRTVSAASVLLESHGIETVINHSPRPKEHRTFKSELLAPVNSDSTLRAELLVPIHQLQRSLQILARDAIIKDDDWIDGVVVG